MKKHEFTVVVNKNDKHSNVKAKPSVVSKDPAVVVPGAHIIIFSMPACFQAEYFEAIAPYLKPGTVIVGMPGQPGFEFQCFDILKDNAKSCVVMSLEDLPWTTRILEYGYKVQIWGTKVSIQASIIIGNCHPIVEPIESVQRVIGEHHELKQTHNYLELYLLSKSIVHPPIMYGKWKDWDGEPLNEAPLFYQGVDETTAECLTGIGDELVQTSISLETQHSKLDMTHVIHLVDLYRQDYAAEIKDKTDIWSCLLTNSAYDGLLHPMVEKNGKLEPDFRHKYLMEDVPDGIVVTKGLALIAGVDTPYLDMVLMWCQGVMDKEYLVDGKLTGRDIKETRCPQRYDYKTVEDLVSLL